MKSILPEAFKTTVWVDGKRHKLRPTVANVLRAMDDLEDPSLVPADRLKLACWRLYKFPRPRNYELAVDVAFDLLNEKSPYRPTDNKQCLDLNQDAALICAAFKQLYDIDLPATAQRLDWRYFQALLSGINSETALGSIMDIRAMKIPKRTEYNGETIQDIMKQKSVYALKPKATNTAHSFESGLRGMAEILMAMAEGSD